MGRTVSDGRELARSINCLIRNGHAFSDIVGRYSPTLINVFVEECIQDERDREMSHASTTAIGSAVGFTGKNEPLKKLGRRLSRGAKVESSEFGATLERVARAGQSHTQNELTAEKSALMKRFK